MFIGITIIVVFIILGFIYAPMIIDIWSLVDDFESVCMGMAISVIGVGIIGCIIGGIYITIKGIF